MKRLDASLLIGAAVAASLLYWNHQSGGESSGDGLPAEQLSPAQVERGRYLAAAGNCISCHTLPGGAAFAGGVPFNTPFGTLYSSNITPDPKTGLRFTATHAQVGLLPMPPAVVTAQANTLAATLLAKVHGHLPFAIQSAQVQGKMLVLTGFLVRPPQQDPQRRAASPQSASLARHSPLPPASPLQTRPF